MSSVPVSCCLDGFCTSKNIRSHVQKQPKQTKAADGCNGEYKNSRIKRQPAPTISTMPVSYGLGCQVSGGIRIRGIPCEGLLSVFSQKSWTSGWERGQLAWRRGEFSDSWLNLQISVSAKAVPSQKNAWHLDSSGLEGQISLREKCGKPERGVCVCVSARGTANCCWFQTSGGPFS